MAKTFALVTLALGLTLGLSACGGEVKVSTTAIRQLSGIAGRQVDTIELSADDVSRLAGQANVEDDVIRDVAPQLDDQDVWLSSLKGVQNIYDQTPQEIRSNLVGIACDGFQGEIQDSDQLYANIAQRFQGYSQGELTQFYETVFGLWSDLYDAANSSDSDRRAAVVVACFTAEQVVG